MRLRMLSALLFVGLVASSVTAFLVPATPDGAINAVVEWTEGPMPPYGTGVFFNTPGSTNAPGSLELRTLHLMDANGNSGIAGAFSQNYVDADYGWASVGMRWVLGPGMSQFVVGGYGATVIPTNPVEPVVMCELNVVPVPGSPINRLQQVVNGSVIGHIALQESTPTSWGVRSGYVQTLPSGTTSGALQTYGGLGQLLGPGGFWGAIETEASAHAARLP